VADRRKEKPLLKICGVRDARTARAAIAAGAGALGFMFAESRRQVSPADVAPILAELPVERPSAVGVVVNPTASDLRGFVDEAGVDVIQLSGDESPDLLGEVDVPVWKALRFEVGTTLDEASRTVEPWLTAVRPVAAILIDAAAPGQYGGSGHRADWDLAARLAERYPVILAGGLSPKNVAVAIAQVRPMGVDVSSGVERDGVKDAGLIQDFLAASRAAFAKVDVRSLRTD